MGCCFFISWGVEIEMEQDRANPRICRRCLMRDMAGQEEYFRSLRDYIDNLDQDIKVSPAVYEARLDLCRDCEMLLQGMCRKCGCYVELRAIVAKNACPDRKWQAEIEEI